MKNRFEKNIEKLRKLVFGKQPLPLEDFLKASRLKYDEKNFKYYLEFVPAEEGGDIYHNNRFFNISAEAVWDAQKRGDLLGLLQTIIDHIEWERPSFYDLDLHRDEIKQRENRKHL